MRFRFLALAVAAAFAFLYFTEAVIELDFNLDPFQVATGYLKDRNPDLFPRDFIWGKAEMTRNLHVCVRGLMRFTDVATLGKVAEPIHLYLLWLPICVMVFFLGICVLCHHFTGDRVASLLVACCFMMAKPTLWDWWGAGPVYTMPARGPVMALFPWILWAYCRWGDQLGRLALCFLGWGVVSNLHPLSGWGLVELLGITILIVERFRPRAWLKVILMGVVTLMGSAPFLWIWTHVAAVPLELRADPAVLKPFWDDFGGLAPPRSKYVVQWLENLCVPALLATIGYFIWRRGKRPGDSPTMRVLGLFPFVVIGMTLLVMIVGAMLRKAGWALPVMIPEHSRSEKFVYLTLPVWMAFAFSAWLKQTELKGVFQRWLPLLFAVMASLMLNLPGHKLFRHALHSAGWLPEAGSRRMEAQVAEDAADLGVARWARENTSLDALFYFDSYEFRYHARRSLVFCWFDRACVAYRPTKDLEEWIRRRDRVLPLKTAGDTEGMLRVARDYQADYLVVLKNWQPLPLTPVWSNVKYAVYRVRS